MNLIMAEENILLVELNSSIERSVLTLDEYKLHQYFERLNFRLNRLKKIPNV